LSRPGVNGLERDFVRVEDILVGNTLDRSETIERGINAGHERRVFKSPDDFGVFFADEIPQVPARFKIAERIKCHGLASRR